MEGTDPDSAANGPGLSHERFVLSAPIDRRGGDWQAYRGVFSATIDLGAEQELEQVQIGFLRNRGNDIAFPDSRPQGEPLFNCLGGQLFTSPEPKGFHRFYSITEFRIGEDDALLRPDRNYLITVRVEYPGPFNEDREVELVSTRSRKVKQRPRLEPPPWTN